MATEKARNDAEATTVEGGTSSEPRVARRGSGRHPSRGSWGWATPLPAPPIARDVQAAVRARLGFGADWVEDPVALDRVELPPSRLEPPASLAHLFSTAAPDRAAHTYGQAYRDLVRALRGEFDNAPDLVARPRSEADVEAIVQWCADKRAALIPWGGGTSVVGGVEPRGCEQFPAVVALDLEELVGLLDLDERSRAACLAAGTPGPLVEDLLRPHGLTLRFFPQSFERSTVGGWIATRAAGHFATFEQHIDDHVEAIAAVTPSGRWESRRLPASGAGPSPDRLLLGSEGTLGVITHAWVRVRPRPRFRARASVTFPSLAGAADAARQLVQAELAPANLRVVDGEEAFVTGALAERRALCVVGFESAVEPQERPLARALELLQDAGGEVASAGEAAGEAEGAWRAAFVGAPALRDVLVRLGVLCETFESAVTWDRFDTFVTVVVEATAAAVRAVCGTGLVTVRLTHLYRDGCAPYFTVLAPARKGAELRQWDEIKAAAMRAVVDAGGTVTHHHAVGRDHLPGYRQQRPAPFAQALRAAKHAVDPHGVMNPGALL